MRVFVITPPEPSLTLDEAKQHLRVDHDDDDQYINGLMAAAQGSIDGPGGWLGRSVGRQTLELRADAFFDVMPLPYGPVISIENVKYLVAAGAPVTVDPALYEVRGSLIGTSFGNRWPSVGFSPETVRIQYVAGYDETPAPIKHALLLLIGQWFQFRENVSADKPGELPFAVEALLSPYRVWS